MCRSMDSGQKKLSEGRQLFVELFVDALPVPWFPGGSHGPLRREPADPAVFIELGPDVRGGIGLQQIGDVQMQVGGNVAPMLFVSVYRENFQGIDILRNWADVRQAAFLPYFPESHRQQIALSVRVTAQPSPGIIEKTRFCSPNFKLV